MGIIPQDAKLTPRPSEIPAWDEQPESAKRVYRRLMENYSGFLDHTDEQVGRLIDALEKSGEIDNTLIFYIVGDNGASAEGGLEGTISETASINGIQLGLAELEAKFDEIGGPRTDPHVPVGWAWAANTPFQWAKQVASHLRRHPQRSHRSVAQGDAFAQRDQNAVPSRDRHRADGA